MERYNISPKNTYKTGSNNKVTYTPVIVIKTADLAHIYISGRTARLANGELFGKGDMRAQIKLVCENIGIALESVGATFADVVRTTTYTTDVDAYSRCSDERSNFFKAPLPTSTLLGINRLAMPDMLVEMEAEAVIDPTRLRLPENEP